MNDYVNVMDIGDPTAARGQKGPAGLQNQMAQMASWNMDFQLYSLQLQTQMANFNTVIRAKLDGIGDLKKIASDSIQKGGPS